MLPRVFVGSSTESLPLAKKIQQQLHHRATVQLWDQDVFRPGDYPLPRLIEIVARFDFALFLIAPEDIAEIRGKRILIARDNVLFEAGLFFSQLGTRRTVLIAPAKPRGQALDFHLPSDLLGISTVKYYPPQNKSDLAAALGAACTTVEDILEREGPKVGNVLTAISGGPIMLLRKLVDRSYQIDDLAAILARHNGEKESASLAWEKAAQYAAQLLVILGLAELQGASDYTCTEAGKTLLESDEARSRFPQEPVRKSGKPRSGQPKIPSSPVKAAQPAAELHILNYLEAHGFGMVSFERIQKNINAGYSDAMLQDLIDKQPTVFRRSRMKDGKPGIAKV